MGRQQRVVITGVGPISALGIGKEVLWNSICQGKTSLVRHDCHIDNEKWDSFLVHEVKDFEISKFGIDVKILRDIEIWKGDQLNSDRDLEYLLAAVKLALDDSGFKYDSENNNIGLFITNEHPNFEPFCERIILETLTYLRRDNLLTSGEFSKKKLLEHLYRRYVNDGYNLQTFMYLHLVAKVFGLHGFSLYNNNACASGLFALESAARQIKYGSSPAAIVVGEDYPVNIYKYLWFKEQNLYAQDGKIKPFAKDANGIVFGDGASALILEELEHALGRKAHIYAEYLSGGFSLEGWKVTIPQIGSSSYQKAIEFALKGANLKPEDIDLINPHGVAIKVTDGYEAKAITDIFGKNSKKPLITAFKPYVGHNLGGCAVLESIILLLSLEKNLIPPTLNCEEIERKYNIELVKELTPYSLNTAMKLSCGFAGYNGATIFRKL
jgi:3-oxoacyl-[acyl-carrier-protein] synthase II